MKNLALSFLWLFLLTGVCVGQERPTIKKGSKGVHVLHLQKSLNVSLTPCPKLSEDGIFGDRTKAAAKAFQASVGLTADGIVGKDTWEFVDRPIVKVGSKGAHVKFLQTELNRIFGPSLKLGDDSDFGNGTKEAVVKLQKAHGLSTDGIVGKDTWLAVYSSPSFDLAESELIKELREAAAKTSVANGTKEWTTKDIVLWKAPVIGKESYLFDFKSQWVTGYKDVINDAAKRYDVPPVLLAGVCFTEVAGDPLWIDEVAYQVRKFDHLADPVLEPLTITEKPEKTSFGNVSMQVRRAAETVGLKYSDVEPQQERDLINMLKNPKENIFLAARHLAQLRNIDFKGIAADKLTMEQIEIIATRYNRGPDLSVEKIKENLSYGKSISKRKDKLAAMIK